MKPPDVEEIAIEKPKMVGLTGLENLSPAELSGGKHVKFGVEHFVFKNLFLSAGLDNILNKKWCGGYVGVGVRFEDEDFKYLPDALPIIPTE